MRLVYNNFLRPLIYQALKQFFHFIIEQIYFFILDLFLLKSKVKICVGIEHVGGDMYVSVPKGDVIMIKVS